ncbi:MAG: hypothetical protein MR004_05460 [Clostridiales bacterium]|nr:hypothetical protein [Clostridiales bacterium]MDY4037589.1 hypothetical protein [Candidatus Pseudoscilispira sp.]
MLQILALLLGLCAWITLIYSIIERKKHTNERTYALRFLSWCFCAIALYIPSLCQFLEFKADDFDSVIDCAATYHLLSAALLLVTVILTIISMLSKKSK